MIISYNTTVNLLKDIEQKKLIYVGMDLPTGEREEIDFKYANIPGKSEDIRSEYMVARIEDACKSYNSGIVVIVGAYHNDIEATLRYKDYAVSSIYIINHAPLGADPSLPRGRENNDEMLRTYNREYIEEYGYGKVNIVNIYDDHLINSTEQMLAGLNSLYEKMDSL